MTTEESIWDLTSCCWEGQGSIFNVQGQENEADSCILAKERHPFPYLHQPRDEDHNHIKGKDFERHVCSDALGRNQDATRHFCTTYFPPFFCPRKAMSQRGVYQTSSADSFLGGCTWHVLATTNPNDRVLGYKVTIAFEFPSSASESFWLFCCNIPTMILCL